jgi:hypothetical protein
MSSSVRSYTISELSSDGRFRIRQFSIARTLTSSMNFFNATCKPYLLESMQSSHFKERVEPRLECRGQNGWILFPVAPKLAQHRHRRMNSPCSMPAYNQP